VPKLPTSSDYPLILHGDCVEQMRLLDDCSIDAIVTDPPYGLEFMGKEWDGYGTNAAFGAWCETWLAECLRVLKPGGYLLAFGGTRTWHRLACAAEDVGFEMRDSLAWLYGSGFPKSLNVGKAIDKAAGATREVVGTVNRGEVSGRRGGIMGAIVPRIDKITAPATAEAAKWEGFGTALKPAFEPVVMGRKPIAGTVAANVLTHGTGALNVDACRIGTDDKLGGGGTSGVGSHSEAWDRPWKHDATATAAQAERTTANVAKAETLGRWPANVILDEFTAAIVDEQSGASVSKSGGIAGHQDEYVGGKLTKPIPRTGHNDTGGASRFFYTAKANQAERPTADGTAHPTVKPISLMQWLIRLVTPPDGIVLEPFAGSGTTVEAAIKETVRCVAIERDATYLPLIRARIDRNNLSLFAGVDE
jgi:DNA modification methylase